MMEDKVQTQRENSIDRRRFSDHSKRELAEAYHHGDFETVTHIFWEVMTNQENVNDWQPYRDVVGTLSLSQSVVDKLSTDERLQVDITVTDSDSTVVVEDRRTLDAETNTETIDEETQLPNIEYELDELTDGTYSISVDIPFSYTYDDETLDRQKNSISSYTATVTESVTIDTTSSEIGKVSHDDITIDSITFE